MFRLIIRPILLLALCALASVPAGAQTTSVVNPRLVEFDPSADHSAVTGGGEAVVTRYDLQFFLAGASAPMSTVSLGKPSPDSDGKIRVDFSTLLAGWPLSNGTYEARVAAVGPSGSGQSTPSNQFDFLSSSSCSFSVTPGSVVMAGGAGSSSLTVTASGSACGWSASSSAAWLSLSTASGTGSSSVGYSVTKNTTTSTRTATMTVAGLTVTVSQPSGKPGQPRGVKAVSYAVVTARQ